VTCLQWNEFVGVAFPRCRILGRFSSLPLPDEPAPPMPPATRDTALIPSDHMRNGQQQLEERSHLPAEGVTDRQSESVSSARRRHRSTLDALVREASLRPLIYFPEHNFE